MFKVTQVHPNNHHTVYILYIHGTDVMSEFNIPYSIYSTDLIPLSLSFFMRHISLNMYTCGIMLLCYDIMFLS